MKASCLACQDFRGEEEAVVEGEEEEGIVKSVVFVGVGVRGFWCWWRCWWRLCGTEVWKVGINGIVPGRV